MSRRSASSKDALMGPPPVPAPSQAPNASQAQNKEEALATEKYRKLKRKYFMLEEKFKDLSVELQRSGERNVKMRQERDVLLDRIIELETVEARSAAVSSSSLHPLLRPSSPTVHSDDATQPPSTAFPRALLSARGKASFVASLHQARDEVAREDPTVDPLYTSRHVAPQARRRRMQEEAVAAQTQIQPVATQIQAPIVSQTVSQAGRTTRRARGGQKAKENKDAANREENGSRGSPGVALAPAPATSTAAVPPPPPPLEGASILVSSSGTKLRIKPPAPPSVPPGHADSAHHAPPLSANESQQQSLPPLTAHLAHAHAQGQSPLGHGHGHGPGPGQSPLGHGHGHGHGHAHGQSPRHEAHLSPVLSPHHHARSHSGQGASYTHTPPSPAYPLRSTHEGPAPGPNNGLPISHPGHSPHLNHNAGPLSPTGLGPSSSPVAERRGSVSEGPRTTRPKRLKAHTVMSKSHSIPTIPRDKAGKPILPLTVGIMTVLNLGEVCMREHFHTERYIFPVGYQVTRRYPSTIDANAEVVYNCTILDGGDGPKFQVVASDVPDKPIMAGTATGAWAVIVRAANHVRNRSHSNSVSGPDFFGLGQNTIKHLIQQLHGADRLKDYVWQNFIEGGPLGGRHAAVMPALPDDREAGNGGLHTSPSGRESDGDYFSSVADPEADQDDEDPGYGHPFDHAPARSREYHRDRDDPIRERERDRDREDMRERVDREPPPDADDEMGDATPRSASGSARGSGASGGSRSPPVPTPLPRSFASIMNA